MTTTDSRTIRLRGPADLLAVVPYLLGFHPKESLVLVGLVDARVALTARMDLADATPDALDPAASRCGRDAPGEELVLPGCVLGVEAEQEPPWPTPSTVSGALFGSRWARAGQSRLLRRVEWLAVEAAARARPRRRPRAPTPPAARPPS